ncbi:L,D-transpeptidase family protein [Streptomyces sp. PKU-EA00015]|uniref:L,D-transpeptidase n=1 Tax=Streptomyces sp. PKU-EA00015 TaxID=2748326 RepID=UPI0015A38184|nr:Ig-like domain-containing protein [Streptomyces sp. PKU-EA00015]NWF30363.1 L,D-transpeptidase family protein [Streptomyces sp. PKU-EA00015]
MNHTPHFRTVLSCTLVVVTLGAVATACGEPDGHPLAAQPYDAARQVSFNADAGDHKVDPDKPLEVTTKSRSGRITDVTVIDDAGRYLAGELSADGLRWRSTAPLAAGARYTMRVATEDEDGAPGLRVLTFETKPATRFLTAEFGPKSGTYGVGQPVTAKLSTAVKDKEGRRVVERALRVSSKPGVEGSWYWVDDKTLHYRPKDYWPTGTVVNATSNLAGVKVGNKLYGGRSEPLRLTIGDRIEAITDAASHSMVVKRNGEVINTIPVTTGKPGFATRNGIKVVLGKESFVRMRSTSIGIAEGSSESYDLPVYWATRVTWSGEYVHAAPWSVGSQGFANVSHGCTGMSTADAAWFFKTVKEGDIVEVVNSYGDIMDTFGNGFGDWNLSWDKWREGSALTGGTPQETGGAAVAARLRPAV